MGVFVLSIHLDTHVPKGRLGQINPCGFADRPWRV